MVPYQKDVVNDDGEWTDVDGDDYDDDDGYGAAVPPFDAEDDHSDVGLPIHQLLEAESTLPCMRIISKMPPLPTEENQRDYGGNKFGIY